MIELVAYRLYIVVFLIMASSCTISSIAQRPEKGIQLEKEIVPTENVTWYFEQFMGNGIAIADINVGESHGSQNHALKNDELKDINSVPFDLTVPVVTEGSPGAGKRVKHKLDSYKDTDVYHVLYLPDNWERDKKYPVIVEYPGNGPFRNQYGDVCTGKPDDTNLGYGISGGKDFIWVALPFISLDGQRNQLKWWGDIEASVDYTVNVVKKICADFGGDENLIFLTGFSRGAIACNYLGLHNNEIAELWCAFMPFSHYDGVTDWGYAASEKEAATKRLMRLKGRPQLIMNENNGTRVTKEFIESTGIKGHFVYLDIPYRNHNDKWILQDIPERHFLRDWVDHVIRLK